MYRRANLPTSGGVQNSRKFAELKISPVICMGVPVVRLDTGHKGLMPGVTTAHPGILWARARHTMGVKGILW